jgi:membrane protein DedA with SNARE-associated domain
VKSTLKYILKSLAKLLAIFFTVLTLTLIIISFARPEWIKDGIAWIGALIQTLGNWNYLIAFASACIESLPIIGTAVPGMNVMILVGGFWGKYHVIPTIALAALGAMIGNYLGYWIGKWYGTELIEKYGDWFWVGRTEAAILHRQLEKNGFWYIVLGKFHNFTRAFVPFIAGASGMQERKFWLYNMIGSIIWAICINTLGIVFIDNYETILDNLGKIMLWLFVCIGLYIYYFQRDGWNRYIRDKQREIEDKVRIKNQSL